MDQPRTLSIALNLICGLDWPSVVIRLLLFPKAGIFTPLIRNEWVCISMLWPRQVGLVDMVVGPGITLEAGFPPRFPLIPLLHGL